MELNLDIRIFFNLKIVNKSFFYLYKIFFLKTLLSFSRYEQSLDCFLTDLKYLSLTKRSFLVNNILFRLCLRDFINRFFLVDDLKQV